MFSIREGLIFFSSKQPGTEAVLQTKDGYVYPFRDDLSSFDDEARNYVWAFDASERPIVKEDRIVFSTRYWKVTGDITLSEIRSTERFSSKPGIVLFSSNQSGSYVAMFDSGGNSLSFREDESRFDDQARAYTWAFAREAPLCAGEEFVLTLGERSLVGEVGKNGKLRSVVRQVLVTRGQDGPLGVCVFQTGVDVGEEEDEEGDENVSPLSFPPLPPSEPGNGKKRVVVR